MSEGHHMEQRFVTQRQALGYAVGLVALVGGSIGFHHMVSHRETVPRLDEVQNLKEELRDLRSSLVEMRARLRDPDDSPSRRGPGLAVRNRAGGANVQIGHKLRAYPSQEYLSTGEFSLQSGISTREVSRRCQNGEIPGVVQTDGGHYRIPNPYFQGSLRPPKAAKGSFQED